MRTYKTFAEICTATGQAALEKICAKWQRWKDTKIRHSASYSTIASAKDRCVTPSKFLPVWELPTKRWQQNCTRRCFLRCFCTIPPSKRRTRLQRGILRTFLPHFLDSCKTTFHSCQTATRRGVECLGKIACNK